MMLPLEKNLLEMGRVTHIFRYAKCMKPHEGSKEVVVSLPVLPSLGRDRGETTLSFMAFGVMGGTSMCGKCSLKIYDDQTITI